MRLIIAALVGCVMAFAAFAVAADTNTDTVVPEKKGAVVEELYVQNETAYPSFDRPPTGTFSRRRTTISPQDETGQKFDSMFSKYFHDPNMDLEHGLRAHLLHELAKKEDSKAPTTVVGNTAPNVQNKTVEVINELKEVKPGDLPTPSTANPPVVSTIDGKDYEITKVVRVQKTVAGKAPSKPTVPTTAQTQKSQTVKSDGSKCGSCFLSFKEKGGCDLWSKGEDPTGLLESECSGCAFIIARRCHIPNELQGNQKGDEADSEKPPILTPPKQSTQPNIAEDPNKVPMDVDHVNGHQYHIQSGTLKLPPLADPNKEPVIIKEPTVKKEPTVSTTPKRPPEGAEPPVKYTPPPPPKPEAEDGMFGKVSHSSVITEGVWTGNNSDWSLEAPWGQAKEDAPFLGGGGETAPIEMMEQVSSTSTSVPPWPPQAEAAPWQEQEPDQGAVAEPATGLLQMAARSCAARKVRQSASCKLAKDTATKKCKTLSDSQKCDEAHRAAEQHCDRTAKATFTACFKDWQIAKKQNAA